jgi:hypothetical protein
VRFNAHALKHFEEADAEYASTRAGDADDQALRERGRQVHRSNITHVPGKDDVIWEEIGFGKVAHITLRYENGKPTAATK